MRGTIRPQRIVSNPRTAPESILNICATADFVGHAGCRRRAHRSTSGRSPPNHLRWNLNGGGSRVYEHCSRKEYQFRSLNWLPHRRWHHARNRYRNARRRNYHAGAITHHRANPGWIPTGSDPHDPKTRTPSRWTPFLIAEPQNRQIGSQQQHRLACDSGKIGVKLCDGNWDIKSQ